MSGLPEPLAELSLSSLNWTAMHWLARDDYDPIDLTAPYQRGSVWTTEQRRNLIKSLVMRLPVGSITYAKLDFDTGNPDIAYRVIDGKQRIEAVRAFMGDEFSVPGWWFQENELQDPAWRAMDVLASQLSKIGEHRVEMAQLPGLEFPSSVRYVRQSNGRFQVFKRTHAETIQAEAEVYLLINFGGVEQTDADHERAGRIARGES